MRLEHSWHRSPVNAFVQLISYSVAYIREKACLSQSTISNYMGLLKQVGLVISERHGQFTFYRRDEDGIRAFLSTVEKELLKP